MKIKLSLSVVLLVFVQVMLWSQMVSNSPYSLYGYGELSDPSYGAQKAMGGIGYGVREGNIINPLNPASFSRVDSMTFMFDAAISLQLSSFDDGTNKVNHTNAKLDYVAMQFPLYRNLGMGVGLKPVSYVGYKYGLLNLDNGSQETYSGSGGVNQVYAALSYNFFKRMSIGVNAGYLFGNMYYTRRVDFSNQGTLSTDTTTTLSMSGLVLDFGVQYTQAIGNNQRLVLGTVYTPKLTIKEGYGMPEKYAVGVSYAKHNKLLVGADFSLQKWSDVEFQGRLNEFNDRTKINLGGEYIPNARGRNYLGRVRYRLGANYANSYVSPVVYERSSDSYKSFEFGEYGVSCGFGFPLTGGRSMFNLAFEYTKTNPKEQIQGAIKEQYYIFTVSYTFNESWFHQRKVY